VTLALFNDFGLNMVARDSQLRQSTEAIADLNNSLFGCPVISNFQCSGGIPVTVNPELRPIEGTNFAHVHRGGVAGDYAYRKRPVPHLLGI
jgi:hypothetical protein